MADTTQVGMAYYEEVGSDGGQIRDHEYCLDTITRIKSLIRALRNTNHAN